MNSEEEATEARKVTGMKRQLCLTTLFKLRYSSHKIKIHHFEAHAPGVYLLCWATIITT